MATSGIWNHAVQAHPMAAGSAPAASTASSPAGNSNGSGISANDFLTLLVTEMQNQDPTANTDPNEYINQLVQVNSLQQLISINQTLSAELTPSATGDVHARPTGENETPPKNNSSVLGAQSEIRVPPSGASVSFEPQVTAGNLAVPQASSAADRIAHALAVRRHDNVSR